jgi:hypothetical protein
MPVAALRASRKIADAFILEGCLGRGPIAVFAGLILGRAIMIPFYALVTASQAVPL